MGQQGFWDIEERQQKLEQKKAVLNRLNQLVPWETFRPILMQIREKPRKSQAGRNPTDVLLLFKMLVLQKLYNISDDELEYQVNDRLSFMQFLGLGLEDRVPDATTVWLFREQLQQHGLVEALFEQFGAYLQGAGYAAKDGQIVDATLIPVPKQRNTREENQTLKQGEVPVEWQETPHQLAQKDVDARWTKKNGTSHYGYKNHINSDAGFKLIRRYSVTDASVHDSQVLGELLDADNSGDGLWADSAYLSVLIVEVLKLIGFEPHINERAYRNRPLSEAQKTANRERSKTRARVEHIFGDVVTSMGGKVVRSIGLARAQTQLGLKNLVYNLKRFVCLETQRAASAELAR
ncbi:Transposase InsH for insertion sequence element IS5-18 [Halomicronema hongdechloris C2206]|uniref:Transposase InsH for insertion sequence element IS5-18 n=1 Tax=Halomicronema hongdechloris C2206 TaxID=1641165 RepID=A0A1V8NJW2_9CYAN|nr:IS5 family transposase [Halomicronema hongdechloris]ASC69416.1 Transposase InsH for insertion sequence element IS5-18 [Halomicronema hongdechloris C2206]ASC69419.1 Transposase InsH for insertion sequence element IS5-18 [Halomicronema hongdechloris C2206]ASC69879.1 Transposase InsH for insertion sequence element IS5-18 [Halomicronema hongdechloris C2206]ASC69895.1 Transposase InsH for insertion sequence element IS5-18 [Halomicronema hongdechloris C2206]ASC70613.1 Transposase InsH for inserti